VRLTNEKTNVEIVQVAAGADAREVMAPRGRGVVVVAEKNGELPAGWSACEVRDVVSAVGRHEGLGGFAIAAAAALLERGDFDSALVYGTATNRAYAVVLARPLAESPDASPNRQTPRRIAE
jgi:hypothetical protein